MTFQELQKQAMQLSSSDRWQLVKNLLDSLQQEAHLPLKERNLSSLRGIAKTFITSIESENQDDYITYLTKKYR